MIAIVDYGMGNLFSVSKAIEILGYDCIITNNKDVISNCKKIILPGVGAFRDAINNIKKLKLFDFLTKEVVVNKKPFLGICLGAQLISKESHEGGVFKGLGWIDASVKKFNTKQNSLRSIHIGWNDIYLEKKSYLFEGINDMTNFYFVHSYYLKCNEDITIATATYGEKFTCAIQKENIVAVQFHPEKSQKSGLKLIGNFLENA